MAVRKWNAIMEELREQREEMREQHAETREELRQHREELRRQRDEMREHRARSEREFELNRRSYEAGMTLCARLVDRTTAALDALTHEIRDHREEGRAQTQALLKLIDRMDGLDGGPQPA
jgi:hypothetical protein